ncbi:hypothetical protein Bca4012_058854 [Brassica carinata]
MHDELLVPSLTPGVDFVEQVINKEQDVQVDKIYCSIDAHMVYIPIYCNTHLMTKSNLSFQSSQGQSPKLRWILDRVPFGSLERGGK